ncbi:amidase signature enzyme, partial [Terfezia boudieri ATCC MYA-4762]
LTISAIHGSYSTSSHTPRSLLVALHSHITALTATNPHIFAHLFPLSHILSRVDSLLQSHPHGPTSQTPLWGIPFVVKDNFDIAGVPTIVSCHPITYTPTTSSPAYHALITAGAICIGKATMDQLATGLTGTRVPEGYPSCVYGPHGRGAYVPGGSSSGSAVAVGMGLVPFALGTDTAGSGRVPAGFNGCFVFKARPGVGMEGVFPACKSLDSLAIFGARDGGVRGLSMVWDVIQGAVVGKGEDVPRSVNPLVGGNMAKKGSGVKFTTPPLAELKKICSPQYFHCFSKLISHLQSQSQQDPHLPQPAPPLSAAAWEKLTTAGKLVYSGAYLYERLTILPTHRPTEWLSELKPHFDPSVFTLLSSAAQNSLQYTPEQIFRDLHFVVGVTQWARKVVFEDGEVMVLLPSAPGHPKVLEVEGNPVEVGEWLGSLMGWANVLGCEAVGL